MGWNTDNYNPYSGQIEVDWEDIRSITSQTLSKLKWYCPVCGVYYKEDYEFKYECDTCGHTLEDE